MLIIPDHLEAVSPLVIAGEGEGRLFVVGHLGRPGVGGAGMKGLTRDSTRFLEMETAPERALPRLSVSS